MHGRVRASFGPTIGPWCLWLQCYICTWTRASCVTRVGLDRLRISSSLRFGVLIHSTIRISSRPHAQVNRDFVYRMEPSEQRSANDAESSYTNQYDLEAPSLTPTSQTQMKMLEEINGTYSRGLMIYTTNSSLAVHGVLSLNSVPVKPFNMATTLLAGLRGSTRASQRSFLLDAAGSPEPA